MTETVGVILIIVIIIAMFATAIYFGHQDEKLHAQKTKAIKEFLKSHNELMETVGRMKKRTDEVRRI